MSALYLIRAGNTRQFKIGKGRCVYTRLKTLQIGNPSKLEIHGTKYFESDKDAFTFEGMLHRRFWGKRISGEWFDLDHKDVDEIIHFYGFHPVWALGTEDEWHKKKKEWFNECLKTFKEFESMRLAKRGRKLLKKETTCRNPILI
jgi:hypothetical protein